MGTMEHQRFHTIFRGLKNELKRTSRFKEKEIERLLITYYKMSLASGRNARGVARSQFSAYYRVFLGVAELNWIDPLISYIESGSIKYISPEAYMKVVELWQYGTFQERKKFCFGVSVNRALFKAVQVKADFQVYDVYKRGYITREALRKSCEKMIYGQTLEDTEYLITVSADYTFT